MADSTRRTDFEGDGYLVLPDFVSAPDCDALRERMDELVDAFEPGEVATIFSTTQHSHAQDRYFLESGDKIRFFFEEEAFDPAGRLRQSKARSINKVGHALHDLDPTPLPSAGLAPLEVAKGTLIVLHGLLPHKSGANRSTKSRHAYTLHLIDEQARYSSETWLQRAPDLPLRGF